MNYLISYRGIYFKTFLFILTNFFCCFIVFSQEIGIHKPKFHVDTSNRYFYQADLPVYIYIGHGPDAKPVQLARELNPIKKNDYSPFKLDGHGKHYLHHDEGKGTQADNFPIYADGIAPISFDKFLMAPAANRKGIQYYGKNLKVSILSNDEMSGVEQYFYSNKRGNYQKYTSDLYYNVEGEQFLQYYSVDNVGNVEKIKSKTFIVDLTAPSTFHNIIGINDKGVISTTTKIYLTGNDLLSGLAKTLYRIDEGPYQLYAGGVIPVSQLTEGNHKLTYYSVDFVENIEKEKEVTFYLDKSAPIMAADILGDKFLAGDVVYFSGRTKLKLTAVDNKSGVKSLKYKIDNEPFHTYTEPFYLPKESGFHTIKYYGEDHAENIGIGDHKNRIEEFIHSVGAVYVDLSGPILNYKFLQPNFQKGDTMMISPSTPIELSGFDPEAGIKTLAYLMDSSFNEIPYEGPLKIATEGYHKISIIGYDRVNNRNVKEFSFWVDKSAPVINHKFSVEHSHINEEVKTYPSYARIFLTATDEITDCRDIRYRINNGKEIPYTGPFGGFRKKENYTISVIARDLMGNQSFYEIKFRTDKY